MHQAHDALHHTQNFTVACESLVACEAHAFCMQCTICFEVLTYVTWLTLPINYCHI
jgi:hypothetical protein